MTIKENSHMGTEISRADTLLLTYKLCSNPTGIPALGIQRQSRLYESETSLVYTASSRPAKATWRDTLSLKKFGFQVFFCLFVFQDEVSFSVVLAVLELALELAAYLCWD